MTKKNQRDNLYNFNIFKNKKGQNVYYDARTKTAYLLPDAELKKFQLVYSRVFVSCVAGVFLFALGKFQLAICVAVALAVLIGMELYFRYTLLPSYSRTTNMDGIQIRDAKEVRKTQPKSTMLVKIGGYWVSSALIVILTAQSAYPLEQKVFVYALALYAFHNGILHFIAFLDRSRSESKQSQ